MAHPIQHLLEIAPKSGKVLDLGAGDGRWSIKYSNRGYEVVAVDRKERPADLPAKIEYLKLDLNGTMPAFKEQSFAIILMRNVIQFLPRKQFTATILPWAKNVLEKGGVLCIETFFDRMRYIGDQNVHEVRKPHAAYYSDAQLRELLSGIEVTYTNQYRADHLDLQGEMRNFAISQIVARKRS